MPFSDFTLEDYTPPETCSIREMQQNEALKSELCLYCVLAVQRDSEPTLWPPSWIGNKTAGRGKYINSSSCHLIIWP